MEELFDQVNVCQHHTTTAISLQLQLVQSISAVQHEVELGQSRKCLPFAHVICEQFEVRVPLVTDDFSACKAPDWDDLPTGRRTVVSRVVTDLPWSTSVRKLVIAT